MDRYHSRLEDRCRCRLLVHLELAKVRRFVAECFQQGTYIGDVRVQGRHEIVLHLIDDMMKLGRPASKERCAGWRAHGRGDVMLFEPDAVTGYRIEGRKRIIRSAKQPVSLLVKDDEDDIVRRF